MPLPDDETDWSSLKCSYLGDNSVDGQNTARVSPLAANEGNVIGTVEGFTGHLGDLDFNTQDGRVYGSLEYKAE